MRRRIKTFLVCPGLGRIARGYETFARECFDALARDERLDMYLFKGAGPSVGQERAIWSLHRGSPVAEAFGKVVRRSGYFLEQMTFVASLLPHLAKVRPEVVFFSDTNLRTPLWYARQMTRQRYRLLLSNGGPVGPPFPRCEHVHQVLPGAAEEAVTAGHPIGRQTFVPYGFNIPTRLPVLTDDERVSLRARLGLPPARPVLLSVGALNTSHKRMDYVIREIASLSTPRPYLMVLGNVEPESPPIIRLGNELLGADAFRAATVPQAEIPAYYRASDAFVLASLSEGFGRVYVEALAHGLPCLAHDYPGSKFVLGECGLFGDFSTDGALAGLIRGLCFGEEIEKEKQARHRSAYERFSWERLRDRYVEMIRRCAAEPIYRGGDRTGRFESAPWSMSDWSEA